MVVLTGATSGIGREAALRLAEVGFHLVLPARDGVRADALHRAIRRQVPTASVETPLCDLARLDDVRRMAAYVMGRPQRLAALVHNAAVVTGTREETVDGFERQFAVNYLAPFLLTHAVTEKLCADAPARVVTTASKVHYGARIAFDDLQSRRAYDAAQAYGQSKLANVLFTRVLARRVAGRGVTANCLHPGVYATELLGDLFGVHPLMRWRMRRNFPTPAAGGANLARLVVDPEFAVRTGAYVDESRVVEPSDEARNDDVAERLWRISADLVGVSP
jgi:NAD(P)-dependent dehydrogenase (short-subunit alcohol dehydrogenase family)